MPDKDVPETPENLGESFAALVGGRTWELDAPDALLNPQGSSEALPSPPAAVGGVETPPQPSAPRGREEDLPPTPTQIVEAMLFVGGPPLKPERACEVIRGLTPEQFRASVDELNRAYRAQNRPYAITGTDQGYTLTLKARYRSVRAKLFGGPREARLSQPALDVLALVAYRQPVTRMEVDSLRGADSAGLLRQLVRLGLVAVAQRGESGQRDVHYGTTPRFLEVFGLRNLDDLPQTGDPQRM